MNLFYRVTFVFAMGLSSLARLVVRMLGIRKHATREVLSEEEIEHILMEGREKGLFEVAEERFIKRVFAFTDATVRRPCVTVPTWSPSMSHQPRGGPPSGNRARLQSLPGL